jgi:hypothetical protein
MMNCWQVKQLMDYEKYVEKLGCYSNLEDVVLQTPESPVPRDVGECGAGNKPRLVAL